MTTFTTKSDMWGWNIYQDDDLMATVFCNRNGESHSEHTIDSRGKSRHVVDCKRVMHDRAELIAFALNALDKENEE